MAKSISSSERRNLVDKYLTELSLLAKQLCPEARIEATMEGFEDEDGHVRIYPPAGMKKRRSKKSKERLPTGVWTSWLERAFLSAPQFMISYSPFAFQPLF
jgi:hypothetical protein